MNRRPLFFPARCWWCEAPLRGGLTVHEPTCFVTGLIAQALRDADADLVIDVRPLLGDECSCRTCGHGASSHIGGTCFECGRDRCWS